MKKTLLTAGSCLLLAGCFGGSDPEELGPANPRATCDSYAAQAIQVDDLGRATNLAAQASQCYADLQNRRR